MYRDDAAIDNTLSEVAGLAQGSRTAFDFLSRELVLRSKPFLVLASLRIRGNSGLPLTTRCCGAGGIVRPTACACAHRRQGASLRSAPALRG